MKTLEDIAEIRMGATLRGRDATREVKTGSCRLVRISDISQDGTWLNEAFVPIEPAERIREEQFLKSGDVLFPNRGTRTTAIAYRLEAPCVLAGAQFFVLRPDISRILPEYLAWFLRTEESVRYFEGRRKGTYVQIIQRSDLAERTIPLPPLEKQQMIVGAATLAFEERQLLGRLAALKVRLVNGELVGVANNTDKHGQTRTDKDGQGQKNEQD